jgi:hypothetical protein
MVRLQKGDEIVEIESTNEYAISKLQARGYTII